MTVATTGGGGEVAGYDEDLASLGLEDVDASDLRLPRLNINHDEATFVNSLTKEEFPALNCIFLGLIKQRIFWPDKMGDDPKPLCKSPDNIHGFPQVNPQLPRSKQFPWDESNFTPQDMQVVQLDPGAHTAHPNGWSSNGHGTLSCAACTFSNWGRDVDGKGTPPPCNEQHTYPLLYLQEIEGEQQWIPAIISFTRTGITPSKQFINSFAQSRTAFFTQVTTLTLKQNVRGKNEYCTPEFKRLQPSDRNMWEEYGNQLRSIRDYLRAAPRPLEDEGDGSVPSNENTGPVQGTVSEPTAPAHAAPAPAAAPEPAPAPAPTPEPAPPAAPQQPVEAPAPQPQAAPAPAAPAPAPAPPAAPAAPAAPAPPAAAAPPAPPAPAAPAAPAPADPSSGDDLPF